MSRLGKQPIEIPNGVEANFSDNVLTVKGPKGALNQPVKTGWLDGKLYLEVHPPLEENLGMARSLDRIAFDRVQEAIGSRAVSLDTRAIREAAERRDGVPVVVARAETGLRASVGASSD